MQIGMLSPLTTAVEYAIYAYDQFDDNNFGENRWKLVKTSSDSEDILSHAKTLFLSQKYQKVEIKKKFFHEKKGKNVYSTYRVFEDRKKNNAVTLTAVVLLAFTSLGMFYLQSL